MEQGSPARGRPDAPAREIAVPEEVPGARSAGALVLRIDPPRVLRAMLVAIVILVVTSVTVAIGVHLAGTGNKLELMTSVDSESSVPTAYAMLQLAVCAGAAFAAAAALRTRRQAGWQLWVVLSAVLALAALDEIVQVHEYVTSAVMGRLYSDFDFPWLAGGLVLFAVALVTLRRMGAGLPPPVTTLLVAGFATYLGGAVAVDSLSGFARERGSSFALMLPLVTIEETLELVGVAVVAFATARFFEGRIVPVYLADRDHEERRSGVRPPVDGPASAGREA